MKETLFNITLDNLSGTMMLTIEPKEKMVINEFCCEMIKKTEVFGLLKLNVTNINGEIKFNYDLSNKKSIAEFAKSGFHESYGKRVLFNLCNAFLKLNEYYLKPTYCLLNPDYTYVGDGLNVYLPYIPVKDVKTDGDELKEYFSELLSKYFAVEGVAAYDEMFKYVYQCQTLDLSLFVNKFLSNEMQSQNNFVAQKQERVANNVPPASPVQPQPAQAPNLNNQNNQPPINQNQAKPAGAAGFKMPFGANQQAAPKVPNPAEMKMPGGGGFKMPGGGGGFKMPGGGEINMPGGGAMPKPEKEKKGLFGAKKPAPAPQAMSPQQPMPPQQPMQSAPNNNFQQFQQPQNNMPPRFNGNYQGSMDKTIMMDSVNSQPQGGFSGNAGGAAYLQYRGQNIPINDNEFVIGKANNQFKINFVINDNPHVSRKHATILMQGGTYFIRDEGSTNGTYVNGRSLPKMMPQPLQNGDEISIYDEVFRFCLR